VRILHFIFLVAALTLTACIPQLTPVPSRPTITPIPPRPTPNAAELKLSDPDEIIEVVAGKEFTITVRTYLTPDYHWGVDQELDAKIVAYVWMDYVPDIQDNPNSSGKDVWRFLALGPGKTTIVLGYYRGLSIYTVQKPVFTIVVKSATP
jgi:predicted secreted protein